MTMEQFTAAERLRSIVEALNPKCCHIHAPQVVAVGYADLRELLAERDELRAENARLTAAVERTTTRMREYGSGSVNVRQVINLLSLTWPDGNYEAASPGQ